MEDALRLIIEKSEGTASEAVHGLLALHAGSPVIQARYNSIAAAALSDPGAHFTEQERALIAGYIGETPQKERLSSNVKVRVTEIERATLELAAEEQRLTLSEYIRSLLFAK